MRIKEFEFSLREFGGSLGDFGTLLPFTVGYIVICGFEPASRSTPVIMGMEMADCTRDWDFPKLKRYSAARAGS